jgi:septal ring factor EnvC (AmiA/AmiB activator)
VRIRITYLLLGAFLSLTIAHCLTGSAGAYSNQVYNNLQRSRDALLNQRDQLQRAYDNVSQQIDELQQKRDRLNTYLNQTAASLSDVERSLSDYR